MVQHLQQFPIQHALKRFASPLQGLGKIEKSVVKQLPNKLNFCSIRKQHNIEVLWARRFI
jgi:hypothetical protein